jgi:fibronectin type 3 domain-containing protein
MKHIIILLFLAVAALAQTSTHSATLAWTDTSNPAGTTYSVYRASGLCSASPTFTKIASAVAVKTYVDTTVQPGAYCYQVTAIFGGVESGPSNQAGAPVPTDAPSGLSIVVR